MSRGTCISTEFINYPSLAAYINYDIVLQSPTSWFFPNIGTLFLLFSRFSLPNHLKEISIIRQAFVCPVFLRFSKFAGWFGEHFPKPLKQILIWHWEYVYIREKLGLNQIDQVPWMLERVYFSYVYHIITLFVFRLSSISRGMWPWEKKRIWLSFEFFHYMYHIINVLMCRPSSIFKKVYSKKLRAKL